MYKINKLILENFKFFYGKLALDLERKNILLYGENGGGKSSIYWALFTFLQSADKTHDTVKKYFDRNNHENLINRYAHDSAVSSIAIEFTAQDGASFNRKIAFNMHNTLTGEEIKLAYRSSDFLNYKLLSKMYDFKNNRQMNLHAVFYTEILQFIDLGVPFLKRDGSKGSTNALEWYKYLKAGLDPRPPIGSPLYTDFESQVVGFNFQMKFYLGKINESANAFLTTKFKQPYKIYITYIECVYNAVVEKDGKKVRTKKLSDFQINITARLLDRNLDYPQNNINKPHIFLNEAKLSAIALSIRFAVLKEKYISRAINILVVDDLLLSLDMSNRNVVLDILLNDFTDYQLLFFTHDRLLFELAKHKIKSLEQKNWKYLEMYEQVREGIPQPLIIESNSYLGKAHEYFLAKEYDISGNFLRKEIENFCKSFLPLKLQFREDCSKLDLNGLILACKVFADKSGFESTIFSELDSFRKFVLNPSSHDSYDVPKFNSEVEKCLKTVEQINKISHKVLVHSGTVLEFELTEAITEDVYRIEITVNSPLIWMKKDGGQEVLSVGHLNYYVFKNGTKTRDEIQHQYGTIKEMYDKFYIKSNNSKSDDFWEEVVIKESRIKLSVL